MIDVFQLADVMEKKGCHLDRLQFPFALYMMINLHHAKIVGPFLKDLRASVNEIIKNPKDKAEGAAALYGMIATLPNRGSVKDFVIDFLKDQYKVK